MHVLKARRLWRELRASAAKGRAAIAELGIRGGAADGLVDSSIAIVGFDAGGGLDDAEPCDDVVVEARVMARLSPAGRAALFQALARVARRTLVVHAPRAPGGTYLGRAVLDAPRSLLRRLGIDAPEPGARVVGSEVVHVFFHDEDLAREAAAAGFALERRHLEHVVFRPDARVEGEPRVSVSGFLGRILRALPAAEAARRSRSPESAVREMRALGRGRAPLTPVERARLQRLIGWVDGVLPDGGNCYRRTLLELALDPRSAREPIVFGLDVGRGGHVAFKDREALPFDVVFEVPAPP